MHIFLLPMITICDRKICPALRSDLGVIIPHERGKRKGVELPDRVVMSEKMESQGNPLRLPSASDLTNPTKNCYYFNRH